MKNLIQRHFNEKNIVMFKQLLGDKFFSVTFIKQNGELRKMQCRLGVRKHLKGGELKHNPKELNHLIVYDVKKQAYRTINFDTIKELKFKGNVYTF